MTIFLLTFLQVTKFYKNKEMCRVFNPFSAGINFTRLQTSDSESEVDPELEIIYNGHRPIT